MSKLEGLTEKELRRLSRRDLLLLMLEQAKETEALEQTLKEERERHAQELEQIRQAHSEELSSAQRHAREQFELLSLRLELEKNKRPEPDAAVRSLPKPAPALQAAFTTLRAGCEQMLSAAKGKTPSGQAGRKRSRRK